MVNRIKGIIEFNKRKVVSTYLENEPPLVNIQAFCLVEASLESQDSIEEGANLLRSYGGELRPKMNAYLGIVA